jgi:hypothetical protein
MRDMIIGTVVGGLIICGLSYAAVAQSAYERYPDSSQYQRYPDQRYPDQNAPAYSYPPANSYSSGTYPNQQYQGSQYQTRTPPPTNAALDQAYRDGYRAGYWVGRRGQTYDDHRPDYRSSQYYNYRR